MTDLKQEYTADELANINFYGNYVSVSMRLEELESYHIEFQKYIEVTNRHLQSNQIVGYDDETLENLKYHYEYSYADLLMRSTIISLTTILEIEIRSFCEDYQKHLNKKIRIKDLNGDLLYRFKTFSKKVINLNFNFQSEIWQYISGIYEVRNCLVHNLGSVENFGKRKVIEAFISKQKSFKISESEHITLSYKACLEAIKKVEYFFVSITEIAFDKFPGSYRLKDAEKYKIPKLKD